MNQKLRRLHKRQHMYGRARPQPEPLTVRIRVNALEFEKAIRRTVDAAQRSARAMKHLAKAMNL